MVDQTNLNEAASLLGELRSIKSAVDYFDHGGRITSMAISEDAEQGRFGPTVSLDTHYIAYPAQMVTALKAALATREQEVRQQLANLGVTGVEPVPPQPTDTRRAKRIPPTRGNVR